MKIFRYNKEDSSKHVLNCSNFYFDLANNLIKFNNQEDKVIWHLGMGKKLT